VEMSAHAASARRHLGRLIGGDEGARWTDAADAWDTEQQVDEPERLALAHIPWPGAGATR